jgi:hypothetical protein
VAAPVDGEQVAASPEEGDSAMARSRVASVLRGLSAGAASITTKGRSVVLGAVLLASFAAPAAGAAAGVSVASHATALPGVAMVHRCDPCSGAPAPC